MDYEGCPWLVSATFQGFIVQYGFAKYTYAYSLQQAEELVEHHVGLAARESVAPALRAALLELKDRYEHFAGVCETLADTALEEGEAKEEKAA